MDLVRCRICGQDDAESLGRIPDSGEFAGQKILPPIEGGELWLCRNCGSMFRYPVLSPASYMELYEKNPGIVWDDGDNERSDFSTIYEYLTGHPGGSMLDVGCYTGNFLAGVQDTFNKYGVEPSTKASKAASSKGIEILGRTLDELPSSVLFDVVVAIDVIEHVVDVEKFLSQAMAYVKENGLLIISTGNPGCLVWRRIFKSRYWYSRYAEHVTFPGYKYYAGFSERNGLQPPEQIRFRYLNIGLITRLSRLLQNAPLLLSPVMYDPLRRIYRMAKGSTSTKNPAAPVSLAGVFTDHHVVIFSKVGGDGVN